MFVLLLSQVSGSASLSITYASAQHYVSFLFSSMFALSKSCMKFRPPFSCCCIFVDDYHFFVADFVLFLYVFTCFLLLCVHLHQLVEFLFHAFITHTSAFATLLQLSMFLPSRLLLELVFLHVSDSVLPLPGPLFAIRWPWTGNSATLLFLYPASLPASKPICFPLSSPNAHFEKYMAWNKDHNSTRRPQREQKKGEIWGGKRRKKARNFGPPTLRAHHPLGLHFFLGLSPHPSGPPLVVDTSCADVLPVVSLPWSSTPPVRTCCLLFSLPWSSTLPLRTCCLLFSLPWSSTPPLRTCCLLFCLPWSSTPPLRTCCLLFLSLGCRHLLCGRVACCFSPLVVDTSCADMLPVVSLPCLSTSSVRTCCLLFLSLGCRHLLCGRVACGFLSLGRQHFLCGRVACCFLPWSSTPPLRTCCLLFFSLGRQHLLCGRVA